MSRKEPRVGVSGEDASVATQEKHSRARRKLLKALAASGGAVAASRLAPEKWAEPLAGFGSLPAHAQTSPQGVMECEVDVSNVRYGAGQHQIDIDAQQDFDEITATIDPPLGGVSINLDVLPNVGDAVIDDADPNPAVTNDLGVAVWSDSDFGVTNNDDAPSDFVGQDGRSLVFTFQAAGYADCVIEFTFVSSP